MPSVWYSVDMMTTLTEIQQASTYDLRQMAAQLTLDARRLVWDRPQEASRLDDLRRKIKHELRTVRGER